MTSSTITVSSTWTKIFDIELNGYFTIYIDDNNNNQGSILFLENKSPSLNQTSVLTSRGISHIPYYNSFLPLSFSFEEEPSRVYELQKNNNFLEARLTTGSDISVTFTLFSGFPDKSIVFSPRETFSNKSTYKRIGTFHIPKVKNATAKAVIYMDNDLTSYNVIIIDKSNNTILLETTLNNTDENVQNLGALTNLPTVPTQIEFSVKKNGGNGNSKIYFESLTIDYN